MLLALGWAWSTQHVWEDYYITYRSSRNLATGHGLVFNEGDRLHTFTSPLGVLLPAAACYLSGTNSDAGAIWIFRVWSAAALAGAVLLVLAVARRFDYGAPATVLLAAFLALDGKSLDFTTNGMETGFLLLFVAYALWAMLAAPGRRWLHLGVAWGGIMWTRPDGFLYIGLLAAGMFLFNDPARTGLTRGQWFKLYLQAGVVCTVVYLPWIEWSWWYYGTPVPHTITAKGGVSGEAKTAWGVLKTLVGFPKTVWSGSTSLESTFLPSYFQIGGWPAAAVTAARGVALLLAFQWLLPWWRAEVRMASFAFCGLHVYLSYFPFFPFPWYLPGPAFLAAVTLGGMIAQLLAPGRARWVRVGVIAVALAALGAQGWLTWQMRREMAAEQIYSATGTRRKVGEWLKAHAEPGQTVFMEPLGHIGYFSGLKTYDFPGLSSREMVEAIRAVGTDWAYLIDYLSPDWVVLRPREVPRVVHSLPWLFGEGRPYKLVQEFNSLPQIRPLDIYGHGYVEFDAHLLVFRRQVPNHSRLKSMVTTSLAKLQLPVAVVDGQPLYAAPASRALVIRVPAQAKHLWILYGMARESYTQSPVTDGIEFTADLTDGVRTERLLSHKLMPQTSPGDRRIQVYNVKLPRHSGDTVLTLTCVGNSAQPNWGCWGEPEFIQ